MSKLMNSILLAALVSTSSVTIAKDIAIMPEQSNLVTLHSQYDFDMTVNKLQSTFKSKGLTIFSVIDHTAAAKKVGFIMQPTKVIIFGNPKAGTPIMQQAPALALQLPLKVLVARDDTGKTNVTLFKADFLAESVGADPELVAQLNKVEGLIKKIVSKNEQ